MEADSLEKVKARRAMRLLYMVMAVFIFLPLILFWVRSR
jgi:hypothetical protein